VAYVKIVEPELATGAAKDLYEATRAHAKNHGYDDYINLAKVWSPAAECAQAWARSQGIAGAAAGLDATEREIVTCRLMYLLKSQYVLCTHAVFLQKMTGWTVDQIRTTVHRPQGSDLEPRLKQVLGFAEKVAQESSAVTQKDVDDLRAAGLSDAQIVALVFYAGALMSNSVIPNALGAKLDSFAQPFASLADWPGAPG
jgi:alkylhydroperoxidase family enzyme